MKKLKRKTMFMLRADLLSEYVEHIGIKQKVISEKTGIPETALCSILQGKRKCEAGEYGSICAALNVPLKTFLKPRLPDKEVK